jgi:hypothetical protein
MDEAPICPECGLPGFECNAFSVARQAAEDYLRLEGYGGMAAREAVERLIPDTRKALAAT